VSTTIAAIGIVGLFVATVGAQVVTGAPLLQVDGVTGLLPLAGLFIAGVAALLLAVFVVFTIVMRLQSTIAQNP
jgi:hypothetical protein